MSLAQIKVSQPITFCYNTGILNTVDKTILDI